MNIRKYLLCLGLGLSVVYVYFYITSARSQPSIPIILPESFRGTLCIVSVGSKCRLAYVKDIEQGRLQEQFVFRATISTSVGGD